MKPGINVGDHVRADWPDGTFAVGEVTAINGDELRIDGDDGKPYIALFSYGTLTNLSATETI